MDLGNELLKCSCYITDRDHPEKLFQNLKAALPRQKWVIKIKA